MPTGRSWVIPLKNVMPVNVDTMTSVVFIYIVQFFYMVFCPRNQSRWQPEAESSRSLLGQHRAPARDYACLCQLSPGRWTPCIIGNPTYSALIQSNLGTGVQSPGCHKKRCLVQRTVLACSPEIKLFFLAVLLVRWSLSQRDDKHNRRSSYRWCLVINGQVAVLHVNSNFMYLRKC